VNTLAQRIQREIEQGKLQPEDEFPDIAEFARRYNASEDDVRNAIRDLVYEGWVERAPGEPQVLRVPRHRLWGTVGGNHSLTREAKRRGMTPGTEVVLLETLPSWPAVRTRLKLEPGDEVIVVERLRTADGEPVSLEYSYYPAKLYPGMTKELFLAEGEGQSSFKVMQEKFGLVPHKAQDELTAVAIEEREAKLLGLEPGTPVLVRFRVTLSDKGVPIKGSRAIYKFRAAYELEI
jgi:GntR family transcriptional regulator